MNDAPKIAANEKEKSVPEDKKQETAAPAEQPTPTTQPDVAKK